MGQQDSSGHVPPHVGAWEIAHVSSELMHSQKFCPDACPQTCPLGHVPPHVGAWEREHVYVHAQWHKPVNPLQTREQAAPGGHVPPHSRPPPPQGGGGVVVVVVVLVWHWAPGGTAAKSNRNAGSQAPRNGTARMAPLLRAVCGPITN